MGHGAIGTQGTATATPHPPPDHAGASPALVATRDRRTIVRWAQRHEAQPALGVAVPSDSGSPGVVDPAVGIRFNFRAEERFRPIAWTQWFSEFDAHQLTFYHRCGLAGGEPDRVVVAPPFSGWPGDQPARLEPASQDEGACGEYRLGAGTSC